MTTNAVIEHPEYFHRFDKIPGEFKPTVIQIDEFSSRSVVVKTDPKGNKYFTLNWGDLISRVSNYHGDNLGLDKISNNTITSKSQSLQDIVHKIVDFLKNGLSIVLTDTEVAALAADILAIFTDLKQTEHYGWASWRSEVKTNSSWEYRLLYSVPMKDSHDYFHALVSTITLSADITTKSQWWGLKKTTTKIFSAGISAMELIVKKGFENPPN